MLSPPPIASRLDTPTTKRLTAEEHLAHAALIQAEEKRKLSLPAKLTGLSWIINSVKAALSKLSIHHWASLAVVWQFARPWVGPVITHFMEALLTHLMTKAVALGLQMPQLVKSLAGVIVSIGARHWSLSQHRGTTLSPCSPTQPAQSLHHHRH